MSTPHPSPATPPETPESPESPDTSDSPKTSQLPSTSESPETSESPDTSPNSAAILIISTRAAAGVYDDLTGPRIEEWLVNRGWSVPDRIVVPDGPEVTTTLTALLATRPNLVLTSGGTGIHPGDRTPDQTRALLDYEIPGFAEELRRRGALKVASAILSRGVAGVAGSTIVINLPGSTGGVKDGLGLLDEVLDHMVDQLKGGDHAR
jgi:molybdenum cofactor synthesis domain-containing protein